MPKAYSWVKSKSPQANPASAPTPGHPEDALHASTLCHIFSYLYLLESLYDGFYLVDSDLRFLVWNSGAERLLGRWAGVTAPA